MKVWLTSCVLTEGIKSVEAELEDEGTIVYPDKNGYSIRIWKPYWYKTEAEAIARAEQLRLGRIAGLERSLARMKALTFAEPWQ